MSSPAPDPTAGERCGYDGWDDGETHCRCGAHFTSIEAFEHHVGMRPVPAASPDASSVDTDTAAEPDLAEATGYRDTVTGRLVDAPADTAAVGDAWTLAREVCPCDGSAHRPHESQECAWALRLCELVLASDWLRDLLDAARREGGAEALREAAGLAIGCEHTTDMDWCGLCQEWVGALYDRAARYRGCSMTDHLPESPEVVLSAEEREALDDQPTRGLIYAAVERILTACLTACLTAQAAEHEREVAEANEHAIECERIGVEAIEKRILAERALTDLRAGIERTADRLKVSAQKGRADVGRSEEVWSWVLDGYADDLRALLATEDRHDESEEG